MEIAKTLFGSGAPEGYTGKDDHKEVETLSEEEGEVYYDDESENTFSACAGGMAPIPGGPFSALTPSMWPQDILSQLTQPDDPNGQPEFRYDEFGFRVEEEDGPEENSSKLLGIPFVEDPQHRLKWIAHLEFSHNREVGELTWDAVETRLSRTEKLRTMVTSGIPHSLRPQIWMRLSGALHKKQNAEFTYKHIVKASSSDNLMTSRQIEKDLLRTMPSNACFSHKHSTGIPRLRRILRGLSWLYPDIGYCQGTGMIAAALLLFLEEEDAFWMMAAIVEDILPASYYSSTLIGVQADQRVLREFIGSFLPEVDKVLVEHDIELSLITLHWFLTIFASVLHTKVLLRVWDMFLCEGTVVLFQMTLAMLKIKEPDLKELENSAQIFNMLSGLPGEIEDVETLLEMAESVSNSLTEVTIETHRRRHLAYLMTDQGALVGNPESVNNLPKQHLHRNRTSTHYSHSPSPKQLKHFQREFHACFDILQVAAESNSPKLLKRFQRRQLKHSRSMVQQLLFGEDSADDVKSKNVKTTELLVDLREAILIVARHFQQTDARHSKVDLGADYSMESHSKDHEVFARVSRSKRRRAKALLDFERHDDDELGFRKNDIITIISQKDEHCWIGELNGLRGWFPAKFVEMLDERSKQYSCAGDDSVNESVMDLVRGTLCPAVKHTLEHGMKKFSLLGGPCHPWLFIEEVANHEVEKDFNSVYSRLVLCKTYRLDEDGKVLTPEELLYRCVQAVNQSHDRVHAQMDVKLRSLICMGLNEQVLHLWFELLCSCLPVVTKWYQPWSFVASPGWVQIKCELRILSLFAFTLRPDFELPHNRSKTQQPLKEGVRDMLVKHHLFSWDL